MRARASAIWRLGINQQKRFSTTNAAAAELTGAGARWVGEHLGCSPCGRGPSLGLGNRAHLGRVADSEVLLSLLPVTSFQL